MDFKETIFLPKTDFQMRGNLAQREPDILSRWNSQNMYELMRKKLKECKKFALHDGPPFANGTPHAGHALNKILKDIIIRTKQMMGYDAAMTPGWDCHGLPIEWKIEQQLKESGKKKEEIPTVEFRTMCRDFALHWIEIQREGFKRLGLTADWDNPYLTMNKISEATVIRQLGKFLVNGDLYRGEKPVFWSVVEQTALADAEIEYMDKKSASIYVAFKVKSAPEDFLKDEYCVIWTTTPWTIPGNRAISYSDKLSYCLLQIENDGRKIIVAKDLVEDFQKTTGINILILKEFSGELLNGVVCLHPFFGHGYDFDVPLIAGDHVEATSGTGLVHTAPGHGVDDFNVCKKFGIGVPKTVNEAGLYYDEVPMFAGKHIFKIEAEMIEALQNAGALLFQTSIVHSYPHSWRSKAPLIFRTTPQWFISMDRNGLRAKALAEIDKTKWIPKQGYNRIHAFVESRGDWCLSRQRLWGVPLPIFISKKNGEPIRDPELIERIAQIFEKEGCDAWFAKSAQELLGEKYNADDYIQNMDTLDVWFESASTYAYTIRAHDKSAQADIYIEGSDQHRGWFQHSLLNCCGTFGDAPFKAVMTHGFIVDEEGRKMSKSLGNTVTLQDVVANLGADIFRMWVASSDFTQDLKLGKNILKQLEDVYRKLRNILRYMLGALSDYDETTEESIEYDQLPPLEKWALHRLAKVNKNLMDYAEQYDINRYFSLLYNFCAADLSSFFFDIRKDCLYCDGKNDSKRKAYRYVVNILFEYVIRWLAPITVFTAEEAWLERHKDNENAKSVHLQSFLEPSAKWTDSKLDEFFERVKSVRKIVNTALEVARKDKIIGSSLQAKVTIFDPKKILPSYDVEFWKEICITSGIELKGAAIPTDAFEIDDVNEIAKNISVVVSVAEGKKCERCWRYVGDLDENNVCQRCHNVLKNI